MGKQEKRKNPMPRLDIIQKKFCDIIYHGKDNHLDLLPFIRTQPHIDIDKLQRLWVYHNNTYQTLADYLENIFPATKNYLEPPLFRKTAYIYIKHNPLKTAILAFYGSQFSVFLGKQLEKKKCTELLASFAEELATFEWLNWQAFNKSNQQPINISMLKMIEKNKLPDLRVKISHSLYLFTSSYPIYDYWLSCKDAENVPKKTLFHKNISQNILLFVKDKKLQHKQISKTQKYFIQQLIKGLTLSAAFESLAKLDEPFDLQDTLTMLFEENVITSADH